MPRLRLLDAARNQWPSLAGSLTASSAVAALPASGTQNPDRSLVWRSNAGTGVHTLDRDFGGLVSISAVAVANLRLIAGGALEVSHRGDAGSPGAETVLATITGQDRDTRAAAAFWSAQSHRHWRLKWTNPGAVNEFAEVGYVHLGTYYEVPVNPSVPLEIRRVDPSLVSVSTDGQRSTARRSKYYAGSWVFRNVLDAQLDEMRAIFESSGVGSPFFQVLDTSRSWWTWLAYQAPELGVGLGEIDTRFGAGLAWEEAR